MPLGADEREFPMVPSIEILDVKLAEPATMATDYILAGLAGWFCLLLKRTARPWWAAAFGWLAVSSVLGGSWHGFRLELEPQWADFLWRLTLSSSLVCACFVMVATAGLAGRPLGRALAVLAVLKLAIFLVLVWLQPTFLKVLIDFAITFAVIGLIVTPRRKQIPGFGSRFAAGMALFALGAAIQVLELSPHTWFNHNDLFHLVQIVANSFIFLAAMRTPSVWPSSTMGGRLV